MPPTPPLRALLAPMPTPIRLQMRRLIGQIEGVQVVGQAFSPNQIASMLDQTQARWLIVHDDGNWQALEDFASHPQWFSQLSGCLVLGRPGLPRPPVRPKVHILECPGELECETSAGAFAQSMARLLRGAPDIPAPPSGPAPLAPRTADARVGGDARPARARFDVLAIGASTGGPEALTTLLGALAAQVRVPIVITQHMSAGFTAPLAQSLAQMCKLPIHEVQAERALLPGQAYLAAAGTHLHIQSFNGQLVAFPGDGPPECFCKPSVDVMLRSLAKLPSIHTLVVILTGMGQDGLIGSTLVKSHGGSILAQDEASSVIWGMPGAVAKAGLCDSVLPLHALAGAVMQKLQA